MLNLNTRSIFFLINSDINATLMVMRSPLTSIDPDACNDTGPCFSVANTFNVFDPLAVAIEISSSGARHTRSCRLPVSTGRACRRNSRAVSREIIVHSP